MSTESNPFFYQSASDLGAEQVVQYYAEGGNVTRALASRSNCYLVGERGAGKSMALMYHSYPVQRMLRGVEGSLGAIGVYIPCNHPLMLKNEALLFDEHRGRAVVEHFFNISIAYHVCKALSDCCVLPSVAEQKKLLKQLSYLWALNSGIKFFDDFFGSVIAFLSRESTDAQRRLNKVESPSESITYTFFSLVMPLFSVIRRMADFKGVHFSLLFDDAHLLSADRQKVLNSYFSYRDHSEFSFKAAIASSEEYLFTTVDGATLVPGHDFNMLNMEEDFQNSKSDFGKLLRNIIAKRLSLCSISATPEEFFPTSESLLSGIQEGKDVARQAAINKFGTSDTKKISDYVYKYGRVNYFKNRDPKARLPQYSGLDTIAHVSTGVVRNALYPCWKMFEKEKHNLNGAVPMCISPSVQAEVLKQESDTLWGNISEGFGNKIEGCTHADSLCIQNLLNALGDLFRARLHSDCSEPRILAFIVSEVTHPVYDEVRSLLTLCRKAQLLYERFGPGKDDGRRERFYATNRLLWISRGLDPDGQHGRLSLKSSDILAAARGGSFNFEDECVIHRQASLFSL